MSSSLRGKIPYNILFLNLFDIATSFHSIQYNLSLKRNIYQMRSIIDHTDSIGDSRKLKK